MLEPTGAVRVSTLGPQTFQSRLRPPERHTSEKGVLPKRQNAFLTHEGRKEGGQNKSSRNIHVQGAIGTVRAGINSGHVNLISLSLRRRSDYV